MRKVLCVWMGLAVLVLTIPVQAIVIDFSSPGYTAGDLGGQGATSTKWGVDSSDARNIIISESGNQCVQLQPSTSGPFSWATFHPTDSDLGQTFNAASSVLDYGFKVRWDELTAGLVGSDWRLYIGNGWGANVVCFDGSGEGTIRVGNKDGDFHLNESGSIGVGQWSTISGTINFATKQFTVSLDGAAPETFYFADSTIDNVNLVLTSWSAYNATFRKCSFDDIQIGNVPEPATAVMLLAGGVGLRRRKVLRG